MAIAQPIQEKRIFDPKIIESYCKAKYGYKVVNFLGKTPEEEEMRYQQQIEENPKWLHIYKIIYDSEFKPFWEQRYNIIINFGITESELVELREIRLDDLLD